MTTPSINLRRIPGITNWDEAKPHLDMLAGTVINDIAPLLQTTGGAPHTVSREVFCYVDYLGALYVGTGGVPIDRTSGLAQVGYRFTRYLEDVMSLVDPAYATMAKTLYEMFRSGTVHEFDPKTLKNNVGVFLSWMEYSGQRYEPKLFPFPVQHLKITQHPDRFVSGGSLPLYALPVSTILLIQDLLASFEHFKSGLGNPLERMNRWNEAAKVLNKPKSFEFPWLP